MAHFAKINNNNTVTEVIVVNNKVLLNSDGTESEQKGKDFLNNLLGENNWVKTSFNNKVRKQFARVGCTYDLANDIFISPKPFDSWILDSNFDWKAPIDYPDNEQEYYWNEETQTWDAVTTE
jgi:hypothetical protein|tara:strand:- start:11390 stop:11755 length:366 start_codon:yes stop_codon:yes gene_type:complete